MRSWENGKKELQQEFARIISLIDKNLSAEINDSSTVRVGREEIKLLRENSAQIEKLVDSNARLADELEKCRSSATRVDSLATENHNLAAEIQPYITSMKSTSLKESPSAKTHVQTSINSVAQKGRMVDLAEHQRLVKKYNVVSENCNQLKEAWVKMEVKLRDHKKRARDWELYIQQKDISIERKKQRIKKLEQEVKDLRHSLYHEKRSRTSSPTNPVHTPTLCQRIETLPIMSEGAQERTVNTSDCLVSSSSPEDPYMPRSVTHNTRNMAKNKEHPISERLSQDKMEIDHESSSSWEHKSHDVTIKEEPVIGTLAKQGKLKTVPELKSLMKRKEPHPNDEQNQMNQIQSTKIFPTSHFHLQHMQESMDLDEISENLITPRKECNDFQVTRQVNSPEISSRPKTFKEFQPEIHPMNTTAKSILPSNSHMTGFKNKSVITQKTNELISSSVSTKIGRMEKQCPDSIHHRKSLSGGSKSELLLDFENSSPDTFKRPFTTDQKIEIPLLSNPIKSAISSDLKDEMKNSAGIRGMPHISGNEVKNSSACLLSNTTETLLPVEQKSNETSGEILSPRFSDKYQNKYIGLENRSVSATSSAKQSTSSSYTDRCFAKATKPSIRLGKLRSRPIEELNIYDFKINPDYNQGYGFAFSEVIRGHARNRLQGCLKSCCEPKYRALAEASLKKENFSTATQKETDQLILMEFLGDNAYKLENMDIAERKELLIQAKTRDLANKHGLHRHAYEAPETPVGIWRANFPSTQELVDEKKAVLERKRKTVEKRYAEAMRPGGAYKFRDE